MSDMPDRRAYLAYRMSEEGPGAIRRAARVLRRSYRLIVALDRVPGECELTIWPVDHIISAPGLVGGIIRANGDPEPELLRAMDEPVVREPRLEVIGAR